MNSYENIDFTDDKQFDKVDKEITKQDRDQLIDALKISLNLPLSDDNGDKAKAIDDRTSLRNALKKLNRELNQKPMPSFERAPSTEELDKYEMEFLIDNWMPADCLTILTGPGGIGKSYLSLQYVAALAMGVDANTYALMPDDDPEIDKDKAIKVVIASYEETQLEVWKRIKRICDELKWADYKTLSQRIHYVDLQGMGPAWGVATGDHLALRSTMLPLGEYLLSKSQEKEIGARLLVLDPSAAVYGGSEIARESVREFTSALNAWCRKAGCATLLIAHPPKSGDDYAGSTDWLGSCRAMWTLQQKQRTKGTGVNKKSFSWYQLSNITKNYAPPQAPIFLRKIKHEDGGYTPIWTPCGDQTEAEDFYKEYQHTWQDNTQQEDTQDDDENPYANIRRR